MNQTSLLRYNFRLLMLNNWSLLVFPLAVSQLSVFWFVLTRRFSPDLPAQSVEMVTPLLAAFLGAHLLSAEYRSRIGAVLASRPVNIARIVVLRLVVMLILVWGLAFLSLMAYSVWMQPFDFVPPILACIPSTLFLTMLALTFATLFRHSLAGFAVAALYWSLDLVPGAPIHPYLSLRSLTAYYAATGNVNHQTFLDEWWIAKVILLTLAVLLYLYHARLVFMLGSPKTARARRRTSISAAIVIAFYIVSGALVKVGYGYRHRGALMPNDVGWFRYQFASYGPVPVASLFGPALSRYVGEITNAWSLPEGEDASIMGDTVKHERDLEDVLTKMPTSIWAPSAADALARIEASGQSSVEGSTALYRRIVNTYPDSPYTAFALRQIARFDADAGRSEAARAVYVELLQRLPGSIYRSEALRFLVGMDKQAGNLTQAASWAEQWTSAAPIHERFEAWMTLAEIRKAQGDTAGAKQAVAKMIPAVRDFRHALSSGTLDLTPSQKVISEQNATQAEHFAKQFE